MSDLLYMAWRYLSYHRVKTCILVSSIALVVAVPVGLRVLVARGAQELTARAEATPLLLGAKGSPLELVLSSLYFASESPTPFGYDEVERIEESGYALPIPLHVRFHARGRPVVGTTPEYLELRGLEVVEGRPAALLGECVLGARVARELELGPGDTIVTSPENVFDLAGVYPLELVIVGVLAPAHGPDDEAILVDLKTTWVIEGIGHGHQDLAAPEAVAGVLAREGERITANASVVEFTRITPENAESFHFHGDTSLFPVTAVVAVPHDERAAALLRGRYEGSEAAVQILPPTEVMDDLLDTVLTVQGWVVVAVLFVGLSAVATTVLVFMLSLRLRRREIETMVQIGAARTRVAGLLTLEILSVIALSLLLAALLTAATSAAAPALVRGWLQS